MGAVGTAAQFQDRRAVHQAIEEGGRQRRIAQVVGPGGEVDVRRQHGRTTSHAGVQQTVVKRARVSLRLAFQVVEAEFVDQQQVDPRVFGQEPVEGPVGQRGGEVLKQRGAGGVPHVIALSTRGAAHRLENAAFPQSGLADQDRVFVAAHEVAGDQLLDGAAVHALGVETPVESFQGRQFAKLRRVDPSLQRAFEPGLGRAGEQAMKEFQVAERFLLRRRQRGVERLGGEYDAQRL